MKLHIKRFLLIVNLQTVIISGLAVISTAICIHYKYEAEFPLTLVATSIIFPIVFSIGGAYKRREAALKEYAAIKGYLRAIYFVSRDWIDQPKPENVTKMSSLIYDFFNNFRIMFTDSKSNLIENEKKVYDNFSDFSLYIKHELREEGLSAGECSRTNQYLQKMMVSFESIKHIYQYRTPRTLRAFSSLFIKILPIIYGPYFAFKAEEMSWGLEFVIPILLTMILVSLENIQEHLENPFDQIGEDDIKFNVEKFIERLNHTTGDAD
ncbi:hypothetical protein [Cellulophaga baltica]|jgi:hypothetical protein|uniref:Uncharacterized protein n=2 Tax=Cellulophaga baltica TaxID=76594 RepID=A0A1G7EMV0_9FLAO|nr:hypothetical protein [Cellulophaga baltica]WFO15654.1 hypothetical protein M601_018180 [Cellulophaga baltica 4]AIZ40337.1 hypothetical protein M666_01315 [Cellulophaga baltica 18]MBA6314223.1 hypothetical protein [Cellulophaga baltica]MCR1027012.1 hypothetical protein [Cellulophaga baltica]SDE65023.1 hypothetical protein SAMN04487992_102415 [Cellulophaga baltica]